MMAAYKPAISALMDYSLVSKDLVSDGEAFISIHKALDGHNA